MIQSQNILFGVFKFALGFGMICPLTGGLFAAEGDIPHLKPSGEALNTDRMRLSFEDQFKTPSVISRGPFSSYSKNIKWIAHTPWNGDFGEARFSDPSGIGPFKYGSDGLTITAQKNSEGVWESGLICSVDRDGDSQQGFSQKYGYFEMRAKLPDGDGVWPAFWLVGSDKSDGSAEIDVLEYYGKFRSGYQTVLHNWKGADSFHDHYIVDVRAGELVEQYHNYGVLITETETSFYFDRRKYLSVPTRPEFKQKVYILANLALGGGWPIDKLTSPVSMNIEYIKAYRFID